VRQNLKVLDAGHNHLTGLPDLSSLPLETLYLQNNDLSEVPRQLAGLSKLDVLWLEGNEQLGSKAANLGKPFHEEHAAVQALIKSGKK
jgi:Leucine-rich repeat (LRR) protein